MSSVPLWNRVPLCTFCIRTVYVRAAAGLPMMASGTVRCEQPRAATEGTRNGTPLLQNGCYTERVLHTRLASARTLCGCRGDRRSVTARRVGLRRGSRRQHWSRRLRIGRGRIIRVVAPTAFQKLQCVQSKHERHRTDEQNGEFDHEHTIRPMTIQGDDVVNEQLRYDEGREGANGYSHGLHCTVVLSRNR